MKCYTFLTRLMYNAAMVKAKLKEENVVKISITNKKTGEEFDGYKLEKLMAKKKRKQSN